MSIEKAPQIRNIFSLSKNEIKLFSNPEIKKIISDCNDNYLYWDKIKYKIPNSELDKETLWRLIKFEREMNCQYLKFGNYIFKYTITNKMLQKLHELDMDLGGIVCNEFPLLEKDKSYYINSSLQEEAISSSKMEGATTTRKMAKELLKKQGKPLNVSQRMIVNNYDTMKFLLMSKEENLTIPLILETHGKITAMTLDDEKDVGNFRSSNDVRVVNSLSGEIVHIPPNKDELPDLLQQLCDFCNNENYQNQFIHPIVKGIILHFLLAYFHPFVDGNGRTSRSLVYWYLLKKNYWLTQYLAISRIIERQKNKYENSFLYAEYDQNDFSYFINFNLNALIKAKEELKIYIKRKNKERNSLELFMNLENVTQRQSYILKEFKDNSDIIMTVSDVQNIFNISNQTSRTDLNSLVSLGYLIKLKLNGKKTGYALAK